MKLPNLAFIQDKSIYTCSFTFILIFILLVVMITTYYIVSQSRRPSKATRNLTNHNLDAVCYIQPANGRNLITNFLPDTNEVRISEDIQPVFEVFPISNCTNHLQKLLDSKTEMVAYDDLTLIGCKVTVNVEDGAKDEALKAVQLALKMKLSSKFEKAKRLMQHAMALNPLHPDVLNHYAEFLEEEDILEANRLYTRALIISPGHVRAMSNNIRTSPVVEAMDQQELKRIDRSREDLLAMDLNTPTLMRLKKEVYFLHIYHTLAIEGNTMSLAETRSVAETGICIPGKSILEHNEVLGLQSALAYVKRLVDSLEPTTIFDVLQIHRRVLGNVDPLVAGTFRTGQVFVGTYVPPPASEVHSLMEDFMDWLLSDEALQLHPVKRAALAHHRIAFIHPFVDGNGRTARLIMNAILMGAGYPPVIIRKQDRSIYHDVLKMADDGDVRPFVRFLARCTECTLDVFLNADTYHEHGAYLRAPLEKGMLFPIDLISL